MNLSSPFMLRLKIGARIFAGFSFVILLLAAVAASGYWGLAGAQAGLRHFGSIAQAMASVSTIDRNFAELQRVVLTYAQTGRAESAKQAQTIAATISETAKTTVEALETDERRTMMKEISDDFAHYVQTFDTAIEKTA